MNVLPAAALEPPPAFDPVSARLSVVMPVFNEAATIAQCGYKVFRRE
jgi:hypothetical protein